MTIVFTNVHSARNKGDAGIVTATVRCLQRRFPGSSIVLLARYLDMDAAALGVALHPCPFLAPGDAGRTRATKLLHFLWDLCAGCAWALILRITGARCDVLLGRARAERMARLLPADLVVSKGGTFLLCHSWRGFLSLVYQLEQVAVPMLLGKPVFLLGQTFGPFRPRMSAWLARIVLSRAAGIMCRETISEEVLRAIGVRRDHTLVGGDLAFFLAAAAREHTQALFLEAGVAMDGGSPLVGVTARRWEFPGDAGKVEALNETYLGSLAAALDALVEARGVRVVFIPQVTGPSALEDDRPVARLVRGRMRHPEAVGLAEGDYPAEVIKGAMAELRVLVGTRMHSNIFALGAGTPVLAIAYEHKTTGIMRQLGLHDWVVDMRDVGSGVLKDKLLALYDAQELLRPRIRADVAGLMARTDACLDTLLAGAGVAHAG